MQVGRFQGAPSYFQGAKELLYRQRMAIQDTLDSVEHRLLIWQGADAFWPTFDQLKSQSESLTSHEDCATLAAEVAVLVYRAPVGPSADDYLSAERQRNEMLSMAGAHSLTRLKEALSRCDVALGDVLNVLPGYDLANDATEKHHVYHRKFGHFFANIKDEVVLPNAYAFDWQWDQFTPDLVSVGHSGEGDERISTVSYGLADDPGRESFVVPNPEKRGQALYNDFDLLNVAKAAFYGQTPHYPGAISRFSLKRDVAQGLETLALALDHASEHSPEHCDYLRERQSQYCAIFKPYLESSPTISEPVSTGVPAPS